MLQAVTAKERADRDALGAALYPYFQPEVDPDTGEKTWRFVGANSDAEEEDFANLRRLYVDGLLAAAGLQRATARG